MCFVLIRLLNAYLALARASAEILGMTQDCDEGDEDSDEIIDEENLICLEVKL